MAGWFRRSQAVSQGGASHPDEVVDEYLAPLTEVQAEHLVDLVSREFGRQGHEVAYTLGDVVCEHRSYSVRNIAAAASQAPVTAWSNLVHRQVANLLKVAAGPLPATFDEAADFLVLRLLPPSALPSPAPACARQLVPDVWVMPALRYPTHVVDVSDDKLIEAYGGMRMVWARALANLRKLPGPEVTYLDSDSDRDDSRVNLLHYEDTVASARLLLMDELIADERRPLYGVLIAAPTRHLLATHLIHGEGVVSALRRLQKLADNQFVPGAGGLSRHVYFYSSTGHLTQITETGPDGSPVIVLTEELAGVFQQIGLL